MLLTTGQGLMLQ